MFQLFHYCREINLQKRHDEVLELLEPIRDTWYEVMVKSGTSRQADPAPMKMAGGI
jgi:flagellin-specific chaperone FliS